MAEYAKVLRQYRCSSVIGDEWVVEAFRKESIHYRPADQSKSELYLEAEPLFARGAVRLLDQRALQTELLQLERRTGRAGRDSVDHPPGGHDDFSNAACGALSQDGETDRLVQERQTFVAVVGVSPSRGTLSLNTQRPKE